MDDQEDGEGDADQDRDRPGESLTEVRDEPAVEEPDDDAKRETTAGDRRRSAREHAQHEEDAAVAVPGRSGSADQVPADASTSQAAVSANSVRRAAVGPFKPASSAMASTGHEVVGAEEHVRDAVVDRARDRS